MEIHISRQVYFIFGVWIKLTKVFTLQNDLSFVFSNPSPLEDFTTLKFSIGYSNGTQISVDVFFCSGIRNHNFIEARQSRYHWTTSLPIYRLQTVLEWFLSLEVKIPYICLFLIDPIQWQRWEKKFSVGSKMFKIKTMFKYH